MLHLALLRAIMLENAPLNVEAALNSRGTDKFPHMISFTGDQGIAGA